MKNQILLDNYYLPRQLESAIDPFVDYNNHERHHESLNHPTPTDVYYDRGERSLACARKSNSERLVSGVGYTINKSCLNDHPDEPDTHLSSSDLCPKCFDELHAAMARW